jgi:hypothetical protein
MAMQLASMGAAEAMAPVTPVRTVNQVLALPELGLSAGVTTDIDGALVVSATAGDLAVTKRVYADGRFVVRLAKAGDDSVLIHGGVAGLRVSAGSDAPVELRADADAEYPGKARRVRGWLARSDAVMHFRQINEALEQQDLTSPEALSLRVTGALVAELLGDPGASQRLSRAITAKLALRLRKAQSGGSGYTMSCWDRYSRQVNQAANELMSCYASFAVYNPLRQICSFVWTLQVESAWFQFLSCSSFPLK